MNKLGKQYFFIFVLILLSLNLSNEANPWEYDIRKENICSDKNDGCYFTVSPNYPYSPIIPTSIPVHALLGNYRYVYLIFTILSASQSTFYLSAYDVSSGKTIISNGDCYHIDLNENLEYELRIYDELQSESYIRFEFLGLKSGTELLVNFRFLLDYGLYKRDIALYYGNSLVMEDIDFVQEYLKELEKQRNNQNSRMEKAKEKARQIVKKWFNYDLTINLIKKEYINSEKFVTGSGLIVTVSIAAGLEIKKESILVPEDDKISESLYNQGNIDFHSDGYDLFKDKVNVDNKVIKYFSALKKVCESKIVELEFSDDIFTLIISFDLANAALKYTFNFHQEIKLLNIYFQVEIKIELRNPCFQEAIVNQQESYIRDMILEEKQKLYLRGLVFALGIAAVCVVGGANPAIALIALPLFSDDYFQK